MVEHTVKSFENEISQLRGLIAEMGGLAAVAIRDAIDALVQRDEVVAAAHMRGANEDLRNGATARDLHHVVALGGIQVDTDLVDLLHAPLLEQRLGAHAIGADLGGVHANGIHGDVTE